MVCANSRFTRIVSIVAFFAASFAFAADTQTLPYSFTYQGSMYQADGVTPLLDQVDFTLEILAPSGTCLLYSEQQANVDLSLSSGIFSLGVGSTLLAGKRVIGVDPGYTMTQVFSNSADFPPVPGSCPLGYHPSLGDARILRVKTTPHSTGVQSTLSPDLTMTSTPQAMVADTLQGHTPLELLLISNASTQLQVSKNDLELLFGPRINALVTASDASALHHHDGRYAEIDSGGLLGLEGKLGTYVPGGATAAGSLWYDQDNKAIKFFDGTSSHSLSTGGSALVSSVAGKTGAVTLSSSDLTDWASATSSFLTSSSTLGVASGGTGATTLTGIVKGNGTSAFTAAVSGVDYLQASGTTTNGNLALWNGSTQLVNGPALSNTNTASSVVQRDASGNFAAGVITGTGLVTGTLRVTGGTPGAGKVLTSDASGNATWATPSGTTQWTTSGSDISYSTGNVGIGTSSPSTKLHVNGSLTVTSGGAARATLNASGDGTFTLQNGAQATKVQLNSAGDSYFTGGNVGVGTANPLQPLHVVGGVPRFQSTNGAQAVLIDAASAGYDASLLFSNGGTTKGKVYYKHTNTAMTITDATNTDLMTLKAGNVGIGTATPHQAMEVNGTVGIGSNFDTTSALAKLDVRGTIGAESATAVPNGILAIGNPMSDAEMMSLGVSGGAGRYAWIQSRSNNAATFNPLVLNPSGGNVGIGTTAPAVTLHTKAASAASENARFENHDSAYAVHIDNDNGAINSIAIEAGAKPGDNACDTNSPAWRINLNGFSDAFSIMRAPCPTAGLGSAPVEHFRLTGSGNVGIGTPTPGQKLSVAGTIESTSGGFKFPDGTTQTTAASGSGDLSAPGAIGATTPNTGAFTTVSSSSGITSAAATAAISATAAPSLIGTSALVQLGSGGFAGGGGVNFAGSASGTALACNMEPTFAGNFADFQVSGASKFTVSSAGNAYFAGNVGIGTATPRVPLEIGGDGAILATGTLSSGWTEPNLGAGARMLWYPRKGAFRAGRVTGTEWNDANIGLHSTALGVDVRASGAHSVALGNTASASGAQSFAVGTIAEAANSNAIALATNRAAATGLYSVAIGGYLTASGTSSFLLGQGVDETTRLVNSTPSSLGVGFNSDIPTLFVGPASGAGTTGKVGIGTTAPAYLLDVNGATRIGTVHTLNSWSATFPFAASATDNSSTFKISQAKGPSGSVNNFGLDLEITDTTVATGGLGLIKANLAGAGTGSGTKFLMDLQSAGVSKLYVKKDGNVGLGTTSPNSKLSLGNSMATAKLLLYDGGLTAAGGDGFFSSLGFNGNVTYLTAPSDGVLNIGRYTASNMASRTNWLYIDNSGNVGIGTSTPNEKLEVNGNIRMTPLNGGGTTTASIDNNGNIVRTASDERLKENIQPLENSLEKLLNLRGVSYQWKNRSSWGDEREIGFVAQELETVVPEVVRKAPDAAQTRSVNLPNLIALVVEAVKEFHGKFVAHERSLASVQAENKTLRDRVEILEAQRLQTEKESAALKAYLCDKDPVAAFCR